MNTKSIIFIATLCCALFSSAAYAGKLQEYRSEADQYYTKQDYKKAYRVYYKLAKIGDHYSQDRIATMYANGHGKKLDMEEAYAWSVLAAEGGNEDFAKKSEKYLAQADDKVGAEKEAEKLKKKYGRAALQKKAEKRDALRANHEMGGCTGRRLGCSDT
jgi:TPR repeat protein